MKQTNARLAATAHIIKGVIFFLSISLTTASCDLFRKAETSKPPKNNRPTDDPNVGTPTKPPVGTVLVDTIRWKTDPKANAPISGNTPPPAGTVVTTPTKPGGNTGTNPADNKTAYNMSLLLPFYSANFKEGSPNPTAAQFALDFYAGAKLAFDSLSKLPFNLNINVLDSRGDFNSIISRYEVSKSDVVIGPIEKENVALAIPYSSRNNIPFVSPYFPTGDIEGTNSNFIQVKPSLKTHCSNIVKHIRGHFNIGQVVLVARSKDNETSRFAYFQEANKSFGGGNIDEWRIEDESNYNVEAYIEKSGTTVFVIPSWNESFVTSILRKLNASPRRNQVVVYGMPQWMDFDRNLYTMYDALKVRVSSSTYIDGAAPDVKTFRNRFMSKYGKLPNSDSFLGYDCALYFGNQLFKYGKGFPTLLDRDQESVLHTKFHFNPVYSTATTADDLGNNIMKFENQYVNILKYQNGSFKLEE